MKSISKDIIARPENILIDREQIQKRVRELADEISKDYVGKVPVFICVLNGGFLFFADLIRELSIDCEVDFVKISSYGNGMKSSGEVKILKGIDCHVKGRDVIVVEDIIDSGLSVNFLRKWIAEQEPHSLKFVSLLVKGEAALIDYECEYIGFKIPNKFVVGYGLDYAQQFRNLPSIYVMDQSVLKN